MDGKQEVIRSLTTALDSMESVETIEELQDVLLDLRDNLEYDLKTVEKEKQYHKTFEIIYKNDVWRVLKRLGVIILKRY